MSRLIIKSKIMKINSKLFEKSFNLHGSKLFGGRNQETQKEVITEGEDENCTWTTTTITDDKDKEISCCTEYECD